MTDRVTSSLSDSHKTFLANLASRGFEVVLASKIGTAMIMLQLVANSMKEIKKTLQIFHFVIFLKNCLPPLTRTIGELMSH